jgi:hopanoid biosynthesis associated protein HpnK
MPKRLIVTADDFGRDESVNEAIERAHRDGILTSASLMVGAPGAADAVARARRMPRLRVGLHVAVVDAHPVLAPAQVPDLVDCEGRLRSDLGRAGAAFFFRARVRRQLAREIRAQFQAFAASGLALDHADGHNHMHVHPTVARLVVEIGREFGLAAVRVPVEPVEVLARVERGVRAGVQGRIMRPWAALLRRRLRRAGLLGNDHAFGIHWSGSMGEGRVLGLLAHLPEGINEMYFHPRLDGGGREDLAALLSSAVRARVAELGIELTAFGALQSGCEG